MMFGYTIPPPPAAAQLEQRREGEDNENGPEMPNKISGHWFFGLLGAVHDMKWMFLVMFKLVTGLWDIPPKFR